MFFRKSRRIKELEEEVYRWRASVKKNIQEVEKLTKYLDNAPKDCVRGEYCASCTHATRVQIQLDPGPIYNPYVKTGRSTVVCGRGLCKNFKQRGENDLEDGNSEG